MSSAKRKLLIVLPPMLIVPCCSSSASVTILSWEVLKRFGEIKHPFLTPTVVLKQSPMPPLRYTVVEVFNELDQVDVNVIKPHSRPKGFMPYSVKRLFKINKDVIEVLLMLEVPLAQYPKIEDLFCRTATWSETCLFFYDDWFCLNLQSV